MSITAVAAASQIISEALKALNAVRERAKTSNDSAIKEQISTLYDGLLSLKEVVIRLSEENAEVKRENTELKRQIIAPSQKPAEPKLRQVGAANYYFLGEKGPFCQPCNDDKQKLVALTPTQEWNEGLRRQCLVCKTYFYEKPMDFRATFTRLNRS